MSKDPTASLVSIQDINVFRRRAFMLAVDHLISPWKYSPMEREERRVALEKLNWQRETQRLQSLEQLPILPES